jgi:Purple acid Phosphatase, N-terminal domain
MSPEVPQLPALPPRRGGPKLPSRVGRPQIVGQRLVGQRPFATLVFICSAALTPYQPGRILPPAMRAAHVQIVQGPALELAHGDLAIIRWTTNNPGRTDDHFAVIHNGTDPTNLSQTAKSPIRLNRDHAQTIFRVRVDGLKPQTTYYYTVTSMASDGISDGEQSSVKQFTTPGPGART